MLHCGLSGQWCLTTIILVYLVMEHTSTGNEFPYSLKFVFFSFLCNNALFSSGHREKWTEFLFQPNQDYIGLNNYEWAFGLTNLIALFGYTSVYFALNKIGLVMKQSEHSAKFRSLNSIKGSVTSQASMKDIKVSHYVNMGIFLSVLYARFAVVAMKNFGFWYTVKFQYQDADMLLFRGAQ